MSDRSTIGSSFGVSKTVSRTVGGIIIPDTAKEKPQRGTVIAAGSGTVRDGRHARPSRCQGRAM